MIIYFGVERWSVLFQHEENFSETVVDNEGFKYILKFLNFTGGYGSCKIGEFVWFIENVGCNLVDRKVGDLVSEEGVTLRDNDFGHENTDVLVVFAVR